MKRYIDMENNIGTAQSVDADCSVNDVLIIQRGQPSGERSGLRQSCEGLNSPLLPFQILGIFVLSIEPVDLAV